MAFFQWFKVMLSMSTLFAYCQIKKTQRDFHDVSYGPYLHLRIAVVDFGSFSRIILNSLLLLVYISVQVGKNIFHTKGFEGLFPK